MFQDFQGRWPQRWNGFQVPGLRLRPDVAVPAGARAKDFSRWRTARFRPATGRPLPPDGFPEAAKGLLGQIFGPPRGGPSDGTTNHKVPRHARHNRSEAILPRTQPFDLLVCRPNALSPTKNMTRSGILLALVVCFSCQANASGPCEGGWGLGTRDLGLGNDTSFRLFCFSFPFFPLLSRFSSLH